MLLMNLSVVNPYMYKEGFHLFNWRVSCSLNISAFSTNTQTINGESKDATDKKEWVSFSLYALWITLAAENAH